MAAGNGMDSEEIFAPDSFGTLLTTGYIYAKLKPVAMREMQIRWCSSVGRAADL